MKIAICIPTIGTIPTHFFLSVTSLIQRLEVDADILSVVFISEGKPIETARNNLVKEALKQNPDYILFLDPDHSFYHDIVHKLLAHKKDIVSALTFKKVQPFSPCAYIKSEGTHCKPIRDWQDNELLEVDAIGMGCCLIKTQVFKDISEEGPWFNFWVEQGKIEKSEDLAFCWVAQQKGYKIYVDTALEARHIGGVGIGSEQFKAWRDKK